MLVNCSTNDGKTVVILDATKLLEKACQKLRGFFSVQRLHGFRQVVQHVQLHVSN